MKKCIFLISIIICIIISCNKKEDVANKETSSQIITQEISSSDETDSMSLEKEVLFSIKINDSSVRLRDEPSLDSNTLELLNLSTEAIVLSETIDLTAINGESYPWYKIELENGQIGWVYAKYATKLLKTEILDYISEQEFATLHITELDNLKELYDVLSQKQIEKLSCINLINVKVKNLVGMDLFPNMQTISFNNCEIESFEGIAFVNREGWIFIKKSTVKGIGNYLENANIYCLSFSDCTVHDVADIILPSGISAVSLDNFPEYLEVLKKLPVSVDQITLNCNNISDLKTIQFLKKQCPNLRYIYVADNVFSDENLMEAQEFWKPTYITKYEL